MSEEDESMAAQVEGVHEELEEAQEAPLDDAVEEEEADLDADAMYGAEETAAAGGEDAEAGEEAQGDEADEKWIEPSYDGKFMVRLRQGLKTVDDANRFREELQAEIDSNSSGGKMLVFEDFDISENRLPAEQLEGIFSALADPNVHVERFRAFGCPTLDDLACTLLAVWLSSVTRDNAPCEIHLSDCAITSSGFRELMQAFDENDAYPVRDPRHPTKGLLSVYLRLENNYIDPGVMKEYVNTGLAVKMKKGESVRTTETTKIRLLVREDGTFHQRQGDPPAAEDVPMPRPFYNKGKGKGKSKSKSKGKGKDKARDKRTDDRRWDDRRRDDRWTDERRRTNDTRMDRATVGKASGKGKSLGKGKANDRSAYQSLPDKRWGSDRTRDYLRDRAPPWNNRDDDRARNRSAYGTPPARRRAESPLRRQAEPMPSRGKGTIARPNRGKGESAPSRGSEKTPYNAFGATHRERDSTAYSQQAPKRNADGWDDEQEIKRRRPAAAAAGGKAQGGNRGQRAAGGNAQGAGRSDASLPFPWQKHWSDEHDLHYYWNSRTGESSWDKPTGVRNGRAS